MADVADIILRTTRPDDSSNHIADIDKNHPDVFDGETLLKTCVDDSTKIKIEFWIEYFKAMDVVDPDPQEREGAYRLRCGKCLAKWLSH